MLAVLFAYPLLGIVTRSVYKNGYTLDSYRQIARVPVYLQVLASTFQTSALVTAVCLLLGYPLAYVLASCRPRTARLLSIIVILPFFTSIIVRTYAWMVLLGRNGIVNQYAMALGLTDAPLPLLYNKAGVVIGMSYVLLPYMVLTVYSVMRGIDPSLVRAAHGLGATRLQAFRRVFLPLSLPGIAGGHAPRVHPEPRLLHHAGSHGRPGRHDDRHADRARGGDHHELVVRLGARGDPAGPDAGRLRRLQPHRQARARLRGARVMGEDGQRTGPGAVAVVAVAAAVLLFLIAPVVIIVIVSFSGAEYLSFPPPFLSLRWYRRFLGAASWRRSIGVSAQVALLTMVFATALGLMAALALVRGRFRGKGAIYAMLLSPMIVPTVITAIGLYFFFVRMKVTGSILAMALGHTVLALPVVVIIMAATLQGFDVRLEQAALSLGASRLTAFRRITLPLILPGLLSSALFAFLTSFDELLIPLFLSGVEVQTLTVRIWNSLVLEVDPTIAAVSSFLIGVTAAVLGASAFLRGRGGATTN